jgi:hypothetical protein
MRHFTLIFALVALIGCGAPPGISHESARRLWEARLVHHYLLRVDDEARGIRCDQAIEVRGEEFERLVSSTCARPIPWTVSSLFIYAAWMRADAGRCVRQVVGVGCICRAEVQLQVVYDRALGYPREIQLRQSWRPTWGEQAYWRHAVQSRALPDCTPPATLITRRIVVTELRPLP